MDGHGEVKQTVLHEWHTQAGASMRVFGGFDMPIQYDSIFAEHLATRCRAGLFDISHMGRYRVSGRAAVPFLQYVLSNNVLGLDQPGMAQYTLIPDEQGNAVDDAYLYRTGEDEYLLVVNAANRDKDWQWLQQFLSRFPGAVLEDRSEALAMMALQGPGSARLLEEILSRRGNAGRLPAPFRNAMSVVRIGGDEVLLSRTGYTGEPVAFEIFPPAAGGLALWEEILAVGGKYGAVPVGLGARDTLRLEAGLPLYGHELGADPEGKPIPIFALVSLANRATSFGAAKGEFVGRQALQRQRQEVMARIREMGRDRRPPAARVVPRFVRRLAILNPERCGPGINPVRQGHPVFLDGRPVGWVTSGTTVPFRCFAGLGLYAAPGGEDGRRAIALAYIDAGIVVGKAGQFLEVEKAKGRLVPAAVVAAHLRPAPPYARPVLHPESRKGTAPGGCSTGVERLVRELVEQAVENTEYRQTRAINLIPSEQTPSLLVRLLSGLDPAGRYAEHRQVRAFGRAAADVYYYQGTGFIAPVEETLQAVLKEYLGCGEVEVRPISGQMANKAVFAGLVDFVNRLERGDPRRLGPVLNNHLSRGGHLSAQYMGALRHYVGHDSRTERPAILHFPVQEDNPYRIDVARTKALLEEHRPQLVIFGKSMVLHPEPVREIAEFVAGWPDRPLLMYDMAHVLGLVGPHFQAPFAEGADLVTGSTHKTFFGPQRGIVASDMAEGSFYRPLWDKIAAESFPGAVSNHHLGTMLGLLGAGYEMLAFAAEYQPQVIANARAFARALHQAGVAVEGDPAVDFTQTHQVLVRVGQGRGPEMARRLEQNNLIANYQALPTDLSFSDASGIRLGVQEMTRFGMQEGDFGELAGLMAGVLLEDRACGRQVAEFRGRFTAMRYCLPLEKGRALMPALVEAFLQGRRG